MTFFPLVGIVAVLLLKKESLGAIRWTAAFFSFIPFLLSIYLVWYYLEVMGSGTLFNINSQTSGFVFDFAKPLQWFPQVNIQYIMGADGLSVPMLFLTGLLSFVSIIASFGIKDRVKEYFAWFLLLEVGMMGVFCALDFFLFYIFWEIMLVPMYFVSGFFVPDDNKFPRLPIAARRSPPGALQDHLDDALRHLPVFVITPYASPPHRQLPQIINTQHNTSRPFVWMFTSICSRQA